MSERASFLSRPRTAGFLADDERLVRDLVQPSFIDSPGLHLIEALRRCASEQGGVLLRVVATYGVRRLQRLSPHSGRTVAA